VSPIDRFTCEETFRRLEDYVDRELDPREVERVRQHLETCSVCASEYAFEEKVLRSLRDTMRRISMPPDLVGKISRRIAEAQREDD